MAELEIPTPSCGNLTQVTDPEMVYILKDMIDEVMIENNVYYDNNDREEAIEVIYPVIASIIFNPNFSHIKGNEESMIDLITYLVIRLS